VTSLTPRERDVLRALADGLDNAGIGARLGIAVGTVKVHLQAAYAKVGAANRAHAAAIAVRSGVAQ
jgi:DNA-binding NarL/FixJ family response regulator